MKSKPMRKSCRPNSKRRNDSLTKYGRKSGRRIWKPPRPRRKHRTVATADVAAAERTPPPAYGTASQAPQSINDTDRRVASLCFGQTKTTCNTSLVACPSKDTLFSSVAQLVNILADSLIYSPGNMWNRK